MKKVAVSQVEYSTFQTAYDFFNAELFNNALPHVLITLQRRAGARGYFSPNRFHGRAQKATTHELAMNPDTFTDRTDKEILSTLAHEMAHVWQQECGKPPRRCYHDREWAGKMKDIGLWPSTTGEPGGKETGQSMTHYIVDGGRFERAYEKLAEQGLKLQWESPAGILGGAGKSKDSSKTKYSCPGCDLNAWAKPEAALVCGDCEMPLEAQ